MREPAHLPEIEPAQYRWRLSSSSGREQLLGSFLEEAPDEAGAPVILTNISIVGKFWPPAVFQKETQAGSMESLSTAFIVILPQVILRRQNVQQLVHDLEHWLERPREICTELGSGIYQNLSISFGIVDGLISSLERPACTIVYRENSFEIGKWHFIVDQSCIRLFLDDLTASLTEL